MTISEIQERLLQLSPIEFERFVGALLRAKNYRNVRQNERVGPVEIDVIADVPDAGFFPERWYFEVKKRILLTEDVVRAVGSMKKVLVEALPPATLMRFALVIAGTKTQAAEYAAEAIGMEIWDGITLAQKCPKNFARSFFDSLVSGTTLPTEPPLTPKSYIEILKSLQPGRKDAAAYQSLVREIFEYLFCPPLEPPRFEDSDEARRNRRDMVFENAAQDGFWARLRTAYSADLIVVDAKNYTDSIGKKEVLSIAHYLKPYGCGLFGILVSRKGASDAAMHATKEQWVGAKKMLLTVSDGHLIQMVKTRQDGGRPEEVLRNLITDFRVCL